MPRWGYGKARLGALCSSLNRNQHSSDPRDRAEGVRWLHAARAGRDRHHGAPFYFLSLTLDKIPGSIAYAIRSGAGIVLISMIGWLMFRQALDAPALVGITLIAAGVATINFFSKSVAH